MLPRYNNTTFLAFLHLLFLLPIGHAFVSSRGVKNLHSNNNPLLARGGIADPEQGEELTSKSINPTSWIEVEGGYLPILRRPFGGVADETTTKSGLVRDVTNLMDYKKIVVDSKTKLTVVRFYAPWCRACKANQPLFYKLAAAYQTNPNVQFVQVPLTAETAKLQQGLGITSLPFGHIYHADVGLVEERKINKKVFPMFEKILQTYAQGYCEVVYDETNPLRP